MGLLFPSPPPPPPMPRDPDRAVLVRRALKDRLLETLRYLGEEIEPRHVGGLGEAQAAGYVAGRLNRAEQQATVIPLTTGAGHAAALAVVIFLALLGSAVAIAFPHIPGFVSALAMTLAALVLLWGEIEGRGPIGQLFGARNSQSVVGVRAAVGSKQQPRLRVVLTAPLDSAPQLPSWRRLLLLLQALVLQMALALLLLAIPGPMLRWGIGLSAALLAGSAGWTLVYHFWRPRPAVLGAGEIAVLIAVAEELGELQQVELWTIAVGAISVGDAGVRRLLERYPFGADTYFINLHNMTAGQPVFVTREGLLRVYRSDRRLLALASRADAADVTINGEPSQLRNRTLAAVLLRRRHRAITITTHAEGRGLASPDPETLARCVKLIVGMIRELDQEEMDE